MPKSNHQKLKILYIYQLLREKTDETHVVSMQEILDELLRYGIKAERKSIYDDIEELRFFGADIEVRKDKPRGYYLASREFELPELKLLVDAVQASRFLSDKKAGEIIRKIESLTSVYEARQLDRQVTVAGRIKTMSGYYNVDNLHKAISNNHKIVFQYANWNVDKKMELRRDGVKYRISPWALCWVEENYYLIGFDDRTNMIRHYRVDKMVGIEELEEEREGKDVFAHFSLADYTRKTFGMFGGPSASITLLFENAFAGIVIDRFGKDVPIVKEDPDHFSVRVEIIPSDHFYGWLAGLGVGVRMIAPETEVRKYKDYLRDILQNYE
ncbi:MAG: WYL domain-containing protein [Lachnospiraceae bacterium]|nr:WYL domain-containing protein [Lachnospiraceae bacterium]